MSGRRSTRPFSFFFFSSGFPTFRRRATRALEVRKGRTNEDCFLCGATCGEQAQPGWVNATLVSDKSKNKEGKIVAVFNEPAPYEPRIRRQVREGAIGVIFVRDRTGVPGQTMYVISERDQRDLSIPVAEIFQSDSKNPGSLLRAVNGEQLQVALWPQKNAWKEANETMAFQVTLSVILCFSALAVILIGIWRLNEWWRGSGWRLVTIGTVCIVLEMISAGIRFAYILVDPFWTYRVYTDIAQNILLTSNLPFTLASGILLTFFWAETLRTTRVKASPFISEYRKSAISVIVFLFVAEITTAVLRVYLASFSTFNPTWISQALYVLTSIILTICYIICAVKIRQRIKSMSENRRKTIRNMTLRFTGSTLGYIAFTIMLIALIPCLNYPWAFKVLLNGIALAENFWAILQVYSFQPPRSRKLDLSNLSSYNTPPVSSRSPHGKTDFSLSARPRRIREDLDNDDDDTSADYDQEKAKMERRTSENSVDPLSTLPSDSTLLTEAPGDDSHTLTSTTNEYLLKGSIFDHRGENEDKKEEMAKNIVEIEPISPQNTEISTENNPLLSDLKSGSSQSPLPPNQHQKHSNTSLPTIIALKEHERNSSFSSGSDLISNSPSEAPSSLSARDTPPNSSWVQAHTPRS